MRNERGGDVYRVRTKVTHDYTNPFKKSPIVEEEGERGPQLIKGKRDIRKMN